MKSESASPVEVPKVLDRRLERETPFSSQLGCTLALAVLLGLLCALGIAAGSSDDGESENHWVAYVVGGGFGFFALLLIWAWVRQFATRGIAETIVEVSGEPVRMGAAARMALRQRGPAVLASLRARLLCVETTARMVHPPGSKSGPRRQVAERYLVQQEIFEATYLRVARGEVWSETFEFVPSTEGRATQGMETDDYYVRWRIEVWGKAGWIGGFMHPFPIPVEA